MDTDSDQLDSELSDHPDERQNGDVNMMESGGEDSGVDDQGGDSSMSSSPDNDEDYQSDDGMAEEDGDDEEIESEEDNDVDWTSKPSRQAPTITSQNKKSQRKSTKIDVDDFLPRRALRTNRKKVNYEEDSDGSDRALELSDDENDQPVRQRIKKMSQTNAIPDSGDSEESQESDPDDDGDEEDFFCETPQKKRAPPKSSSKRKVQSRAKVTKKAKNLKFDSTDEEEESDDDDDDDEFGWDSKKAKTETSGPKIDKLFDWRVTDGVTEWLVKWKGESYAKIQWLPEETIVEIPGGKQRMRNLMRKPPNRSLPYFEDDYTIVDRVIASRVAWDETTETSTKEYLVKWKSLPYGESTWEKNSALTEEDIQEYKKRNTPPSGPLGYNRPVMYQKGISPPVFIDPSLQLRAYQSLGFRWLLFSYTRDRNVILGDEMGLGKTIQSISLLYYLSKELNIPGPFLVVAPLVTLEQWRREIESWTTMNCVLFHGTAKDREVIIDNEFYYEDERHANKLKFQVLITTYELVNQETEVLSLINWEYLVLDEGHRIKSQDSKLLQKLNQLRLKRKLVLTGTPLQNHVRELWTILNFLNSDKFPSQEQFLEEYGQLSSEKLDKLKQVIKPYLLRRMKRDVEKSLPRKEEKIVEVELTGIQKQYYRAILDRNREFLQRGLKKKSQAPTFSNIMMELRKCCNHPYLIRGAEERLLLERPNEQIGELLVSSSAKLVVMDKLLTKLREEKRQVLVFSQMKIVLDILEDFLRFRKYPFERLDGNVKKEARVAAIDRFTNQKGNQFIFLLSTRAGGLGLNLTRADTVIIFDSDWNPQNDLQAMARAHRIGQTSNVVVYRLVTRGTYEQRMLEIAGKKMALDTAVLGDLAQDGGGGGDKGKVSKMGGMNAKEIDELLRYGAYNMFQENDEEEKKKDQMLREQDIDDILQRASTVVHDEEGEEGDALSKVSFCISEKDREVDLNAEDFWEKVLPEFKTLDSLKQDLNEGKVNTLEEQKAFLGHLETIVNETKVQIRQGSRVEELQAKIDLCFFLDKIHQNTNFSEKLRTKAMIMSTSLQLGKRSRSSTKSDTFEEEDEVSVQPPPNKRQKTSGGGGKEKPKKSKLLKAAKRKGVSDDDDFDDIESSDDQKKGPSQRSSKGSSPNTASWSVISIKKVRQMLLRFGLEDKERVYECAPVSIKRCKNLHQFRELHICMSYFALDAAASNKTGKSNLGKYGQLIRKHVAVHQKMIADFKSLKFEPQPNEPPAPKGHKKLAKIEVLNDSAYFSRSSSSPPTFFPGEPMTVKLTMSESLEEENKAVYFEIVGKIPFYTDGSGSSGRVSDTRTFFSRLYPPTIKEDSDIGSAERVRTLEVSAPGCPGDYFLKCVKMYYKEAASYKHIVCGVLEVTVNVPDPLKEAGLTTKGKVAPSVLQKISLLNILHQLVSDGEWSWLSDAPSATEKIVWWWTAEDDKNLLKSFYKHGFDNIEDLEKDPELGFSLPVLLPRLKKQWEEISSDATRDRLLMAYPRKRGKDDEEPLREYCSPEMKVLRTKLTKRAQTLIAIFETWEKKSSSDKKLKGGSDSENKKSLKKSSVSPTAPKKLKSSSSLNGLKSSESPASKKGEKKGTSSSSSSSAAPKLKLKIPKSSSSSSVSQKDDTKNLSTKKRKERSLSEWLTTEKSGERNKNHEKNDSNSSSSKDH